MSGESSTTILSPRNDNLASIGLKNANRGAVQFAEGDLSDTTGEESDAGAALAFCRKRLAEIGKEKAGIDAREKFGVLLQSEETQNAAAANQRLNSGALADAGEGCHCGNPPRMRKQATIDKIGEKSREKRTPIFLLNLGAGKFDELAVLDA